MSQYVRTRRRESAGRSASDAAAEALSDRSSQGRSEADSPNAVAPGGVSGNVGYNLADLAIYPSAEPAADSAAQSGPIIQRQPASTADASTAQHSPSGGSKAGAKESGDDFIDFLQGIDDLTTAAAPATQGAGLAKVSFGGHISDQHLGQLEMLRSALLLVYDSSPDAHHQALAVWESIQGDLWAGLRQAPRFIQGDITQLNDMIGKDLTYISEQLIRPAAYWEAHQQGLERGKLEAPDLVDMQAKLEAEENALEEAEGLSNDAGKLISEGIGAAILGKANLGKEIFEIVRMPGEMGEKLEKAKEMHVISQVATAIDLVAEIAKLKTVIIETTFDVLKDRAEDLAKEALKEGSEELAKHWEGLAEGYGKYVQSLKTIGTVFGVVVAAADLLKAFDDALHGDWEAAAGHAAEGGIGLLSALGPEGSAPLIGTIVILAKVEIAAIHMAAEFIRWCEDETVRDAARSFIDVCVKVARWPAQDLVADVEAYFDPSNSSIQDLIEKRFNTYQAPMVQGLAAIAAEVECTEPSCLGGHGDLRDALGEKAREAISGLAFPTDPLSMAQQIADIFGGANAMAKYVHSAYPTDTEKAARESKKKKEGGE